MTFSKVIKKRTNVPSFNRGDSPFAHGQSAFHSFALRQGVAGGAFSNKEVVAVSVSVVFVEASGEGGGIGLDIYCPFLRKVLPHVFHSYSFCFVFFLFAFL